MLQRIIKFIKSFKRSKTYCADKASILINGKKIAITGPYKYEYEYVAQNEPEVMLGLLEQLSKCEGEFYMETSTGVQLDSFVDSAKVLGIYDTLNNHDNSTLTVPSPPPEMAGTLTYQPASLIPSYEQGYADAIVDILLGELTSEELENFKKGRLI